MLIITQTGGDDWHGQRLFRARYSEYTKDAVGVAPVVTAVYCYTSDE